MTEVRAGERSTHLNRQHLGTSRPYCTAATLARRQKIFQHFTTDNFTFKGNSNILSFIIEEGIF